MAAARKRLVRYLPWEAGSYLKSPYGDVMFRSYADARKGAETMEALFVQTYESVCDRKTRSIANQGKKKALGAKNYQKQPMQVKEKETYFVLNAFLTKNKILCYHQNHKNAMTQSSKQGRAFREVPVGARHKVDGIAELAVSAAGPKVSRCRRVLPLQCRDMMVSRRGCSHKGNKEEWYRGRFFILSSLLPKGRRDERIFLFSCQTIQHFCLQEEETMKKRSVPKTPFFAAFSVGAVLFSAHAGGGFATGNQANTYYVGLGWAGVVSAIVAMLLLTLTMRQAMVMYNSRGLTSYKQLFETLYHPFDKIEWLFEVFFYIMVLMAVAAAISGAASAIQGYFGMNYYLGVVAVGILVLMLTIFGAGIVRAASTYMGIAILVTAISIYAIGIFKSGNSIGSVLTADFQTTGFGNMPKAVLNAFTYAGFQCVTLPTMAACGTTT